MRLFSRLNPAVKLVVLTIVNIVLMVIFDPWTPGLLYLLLLSIAILEKDVPTRTLVIGHIPFVLFGFSMLAVNAFTRDGTVVASIGSLEITDNGLSIGGALALRTLAIGAGVILFIRTTPPAAFVDSLRQNLRIPQRACFATMAGYRILAELPTQWTTLVRAHAVRRDGGITARGRVKVPIHVAARVTISLLAVAIRRGERLSITMETRGLGVGPRTSWRPQVITRRDIIFAVVSLGLFGAILTTAALTGVLHGPGTAF